MFLFYKYPILPPPPRTSTSVAWELTCATVLRAVPAFQRHATTPSALIHARGGGGDPGVAYMILGWHLNGRLEGTLAIISRALGYYAPILHISIRREQLRPDTTFWYSSSLS